jgi:hypothetical protein
MPDDSPLLMKELLTWIAERPRSFDETREAWKTSCPRQSVWEDAQIEGLVRLLDGHVVLTELGESALKEKP